MLKKLQSFYKIIKERQSLLHNPVSDDSVYCLPLRVHGRVNKRTNRDFLFDEISWMALDFYEERRLKIRLAFLLAADAAKFVLSKTSPPLTQVEEIGSFCQQAFLNDVPVFGPPDRKDLNLPCISGDPRTSMDISTDLPQTYPDKSNALKYEGHSLTLLEGPFSYSSAPPNSISDSLTTLNGFLLHHLENSISSSRSTSPHPVIPPWSLLEDQLILEACLQFNFNCHLNSALHQQTASPKNFPIIIQHELMPPCNLVSELLNATCHHNSFVRTPFSVLQRFYYLVKLDGKSAQRNLSPIEEKSHSCSKSFLLRIYQKAINSHKPQNIDNNTNLPPSWKLKQWEKRLFIFGLIKKKIHTRGGSILTKDHKRQVNLTSERRLSKLSTFSSLSGGTHTASPTFKSHLPYNLYVSAISAHPSHESAVKKATSGIPKHLVSSTCSASDLALKRLHRVYHFQSQPNIGPVIISPIGGGFPGMVPPGTSARKG